MLFDYRARTSQGTEVEGSLEAADKFELAKRLRERGLLAISAKPQKKATRDIWVWQHVGARDKVMLAANLAAMIEAGLALTRALSIVERETHNKYLQQVVSTLAQRIHEGENFSKALGAFPKIFPPLFVSMVMAGEETGKLPEALRLIANQLNKSYELRRKIRGAMIYPGIVLSLIFAIGVLMMIFVVPTLVTTFKDLKVELPLSTRIVIGLSDLFSQHYLYLLGGLVVVAAAAVAFFRTERGRWTWAWTVLHLPIFGNISRKAGAALLMQTMGSLLLAGVSMVESLRICARVVQNPYHQQVIARGQTFVEKGLPLSKTFAEATKLYPILVGELISVGEETGKLSEMLFRGAGFFEAEVDQITKNLTTILEPLLMIVIGATVGFFAISIISPIYSLSNAF